MVIGALGLGDAGLEDPAAIFYQGSPLWGRSGPLGTNIPTPPPPLPIEVWGDATLWRTSLSVQVVMAVGGKSCKNFPRGLPSGAVSTICSDTFL